MIYSNVRCFFLVSGICARGILNKPQGSKQLPFQCALVCAIFALCALVLLRSEEIRGHCQTMISQDSQDVFFMFSPVSAHCWRLLCSGRRYEKPHRKSQM